MLRLLLLRRGKMICGGRDGLILRSFGIVRESVRRTGLRGLLLGLALDWLMGIKIRRRCLERRAGRGIWRGRLMLHGRARNFRLRGL